MSDLQWMWFDRNNEGDSTFKPGMYYDTQNYNNAQLTVPQYKYLPAGNEVSVTIPNGGAESGLSGPIKYTPWSWCSTVWSVLSLICCCTHIFGFIGLICSMFSYVDHKAGDYSRSSYKRKCSWCWTITGIVLSLLGVLAVILIFVVFPDQLKDQLKLVNYDSEPLKEW